MKQAKKQTAKDWRKVSTIDDGEIAYLVHKIIALDPDRAVAPLLLLVDAIQHAERGDEGDVAKRAALFHSETGSELAESYTKLLRSYFSREGKSSQSPDIDGALKELKGELQRALSASAL